MVVVTLNMEAIILAMERIFKWRLYFRGFLIIVAQMSLALISCSEVNENSEDDDGDFDCDIDEGYDDDGNVFEFILSTLLLGLLMTMLKKVKI